MLHLGVLNVQYERQFNSWQLYADLAHVVYQCIFGQHSPLFYQIAWKQEIVSDLVKVFQNPQASNYHGFYFGWVDILSFFFFACSAPSVQKGWLKTFWKIRKRSGPRNPPQMSWRFKEKYCQKVTSICCKGSCPLLGLSVYPSDAERLAPGQPTHGGLQLMLQEVSLKDFGQQLVAGRMRAAWSGGRGQKRLFH